MVFTEERSARAAAVGGGSPGPVPVCVQYADSSSSDLWKHLIWAGPRPGPRGATSVERTDQATCCGPTSTTAPAPTPMGAMPWPQPGRPPTKPAGKPITWPPPARP